MAKKASSRKVKKASAGDKAGRAETGTDAKKPRASRSRTAAKSALTKAQIAKLREALVEKRRALIGDMAGIEDQAIGENRQQPPSDPTDLGSDSYEQEFSLGLLESERALLDEIDEALARIEAGTYGICAGTGKPISLARLQARPWAKYCIEYARQIERGIVRPKKKEEVFEIED